LIQVQFPGGRFSNWSRSRAGQSQGLPLYTSREFGAKLGEPAATVATVATAAKTVMTKKKKKKSRKIWVIKVGSALFVEGGPLLVRDWMHQIERLRRQYQIDIIWVTSGAIASARERTRKQWEKLAEKQALSAIGQPILMDAYNLALQSVGLLGAQVLLTYDDIARRAHAANLKNTLTALLDWQVVPILNENDAVATEEIQFGDNDLLSAKVAGLVKAERLVILTNVDGLYSENPNKSKNARLISHLPRVTPSLLKGLGRDQAHAVSPMGRGGMFSKIRAAAYAQSKGVPTCIMRGDIHDGLIKLIRGEALGTCIGQLQP
jgi:glutamate 5-kinase